MKVTLAATTKAYMDGGAVLEAADEINVVADGNGVVIDV